MHKRLKILMLSESSYPRHPGGAGKCSHQLAAGLVARGHTVHLVSETADTSLREVIDGVEVHRIGRSDTSALPVEEVEAASAAHVLEYIERKVPLQSIDLVHDSGGFLSYFFPVELALKERWRLPLVLHYRYLMVRHRILETKTGRLNFLGREFLGFESLLHIRSQGFPARFADRVVVLSQDDLDFVREQYRPAGPLELIPDPVVIHEVSPTERAARRRALVGNNEAPLVLFGGRIGDRLFKGTDIVFQAIHRLRAAIPQCRLVMAANDESVLEPFRRSLGDTVVEVGWLDDARELATTLAAVDVVWVPSRYEPFGLMCAEALAAGTPVVASPVGGLREMIEDGQTGLLLSGDQPEAWVEELADRTGALLGDVATLSAMGTRASAFAREHLSLDRVAQRMEDLYLDAIEPAGSNGESVIEKPSWSDDDTKAYLDRLIAMAGAEAEAHGRAVLASWDASADDRCRRCTHARMADTIQELDRLGRSRVGRAFRGESWRQQLARASADVCPLALRQKELASVRTYGPGKSGLRASTKS